MSPQVWTQWDSDSTWAESLLKEIDTLFTKMHQKKDTKEISSSLQVIFSNTFIYCETLCPGAWKQTGTV